MKNYTLLILFTLISSSSFSQNASTLFLTYSMSNPRPIYNRAVDGGAGYKGVASNSFGLRYFIKSSKIITLETGIDHSLYQFKLDHVNHPDVIIPDITQSKRIISVPIYAHLTFLKYLFVNGGLLIDAEIDKKQSEIDKQTGIGLGLGIGLKHNYKHVSIFINPFLERDGFWGFARQGNGIRQSLINPGGRIGIGYSF